MFVFFKVWCGPADCSAVSGSDRAEPLTSAYTKTQGRIIGCSQAYIGLVGTDVALLMTHNVKLQLVS